MKLISILFVISLLVLGCNKPADETNSANSTPEPGKSVSGTSSDPGISPVGGGAAAGMTPVTNPGAVEGAGAGGVGQAAKDMARSKAASGASSLNQMPAEDGQ